MARNAIAKRSFDLNGAKLTFADKSELSGAPEDYSEEINFALWCHGWLAKVGDSFCRYVYLCKYENNFLRWVFTYYRPRQGWLFFRLDFDDNVNALFEDARRAASAAPKTAAPKTAAPDTALPGD